MLDAYYAHDWKEVKDFVKRYGVAALVVQRAHFQPSFIREGIYVEPFNSAIKARWEGRTGGFVLEEPPNELRCFENARYVVLCWERKTEG